MLNRTTIRHLLAFGWGVYGGVLIGYFASRKTHQRLADEQIKSVKESYSLRYKTGKYESVASTAEQMKLREKSPDILADDLKVSEIIRTGQYNMDQLPDEQSRDLSADTRAAEQAASIVRAEEMDVIEYEEVDPEDLEANVEFEPMEQGSLQAPDQFERTVVTNPDIPYVISYDEFMDDEPRHDKHTLTYYDGDDVLASDNDQVINNIAACVGEEFLVQFGHRSGDKNLVYVRNERLRSDYEVALDPRSYSSAILGYTDKRSSAIRFMEDD